MKWDDNEANERALGDGTDEAAANEAADAIGSGTGHSPTPADELAARLTAYALGELDDSEQAAARATVESRLSGAAASADARQIVVDTRATAAALAAELRVELNADTLTLGEARLEQIRSAALAASAREPARDEALSGLAPPSAAHSKGRNQLLREALAS